jgi:outer membrane usher protein
MPLLATCCAVTLWATAAGAETPPRNGGRTDAPLWFASSASPEKPHASRPVSGVLRTSLASRYGVALFSLRASEEGGNARIGRLDTAWATTLPGQRDKLRLGDSVDPAESWGAPTRFAGLHYGTTVGTLHARSTVQEWLAVRTRLVAAQRSFRHDLRVTPYSAPASGELPSAPFGLTQPGRVDRGFAVGVLRANYGLDDDRYGPAFASATLRRGLSEDITTELRGSVQRGAGHGGFALRARAHGLGTLSAAAAASRSEAGLGRLVQVGFQVREAGFTASIRSQWVSAQFRQLGMGDARVPPQHWSTARATYDSARHGALRVGYDVLAHNGEALTRIVHGSYRVAVGRFSALSLSVTRILDPEPDTSLMLAITLPLDRIARTVNRSTWASRPMRMLDRAPTLANQAGALSGSG